MEYYFKLIFENNFSVYEIELGKIKSFPKLNLNLSDEALENLRKNEDYEYDISIMGKRISKDEENVNLNNYGKKEISYF